MRENISTCAIFICINNWLIYVFVINRFQLQYTYFNDVLIFLQLTARRNWPDCCNRKTWTFGKKRRRWSCSDGVSSTMMNNRCNVSWETQKLCIVGNYPDKKLPGQIAYKTCHEWCRLILSRVNHPLVTCSKLAFTFCAFANSCQQIVSDVTCS